MSEFNIASVYEDTVNTDNIDLPDKFIDIMEEDVPNDNDAEKIIIDELGNEFNEGLEDVDENEKSKDEIEELVGDDIMDIDPAMSKWAKLFVQSSDMYDVLKKSGNIPKGVSEPSTDMDVNQLLKIYSILKCKFKNATSSSGVAEECLLAVCNGAAKYFDGSGDTDTFNPDLTALPDDISLKIERDASLKNSLKNLSGVFQSDFAKIGTTLILSVTSLALSNSRRKRSPSSSLSKALQNVDY
jgi:hypothetical protein